MRPRHSSGMLHSVPLSSGAIPSPQGSRKVRFIKRGLSTKKSLTVLSDTDHEIITLLCEHRVVTTQQFQILLGIPERTIRYRLERLWELGLVGGMQPYAERGSSPMHWWPSRAADGCARGLPLPRGGEREDPREQFLRHAAAITGLYAAVHRLAPTLGWEILSFNREAEAKEEFAAGDRDSAVVPDVSLVIRAGEAEYHALIEVDLGTMSIPHAARKFGLYAGWVSSRAWEKGHPYVPVVLFLTTTGRRAEKILGKAEQRLSAESHRALTLAEAKLLDSVVVAASECVHRPEAALADPVWTSRRGGSALRLEEILRPPWQRWRQAMEEERATAEARRAWRERLSRDPESQRRILQERWRDSKIGGVGEYLRHVIDLDPEDRAALDALIEETEPMTEVERRAYGFYLRRTHLDDYDRPKAIDEELPLSPEERTAISTIRCLYLERHRRTVAALHHRHPHLPWLLTAIRRLDEGKLLSSWSRGHLPEQTNQALRKIEAANDRMGEYLGWRVKAIVDERRKRGLAARLLVHTPGRVGRSLDEEWLRLCPECEQLFPLTDEERTMPWREPCCPHCGTPEGLLAPSEAETRGLLVRDDEGFWRVRHLPVPGWATSGKGMPGALEEEDR